MYLYLKCGINAGNVGRIAKTDDRCLKTKIKKATFLNQIAITKLARLRQNCVLREIFKMLFCSHPIVAVSQNIMPKLKFDSDGQAFSHLNASQKPY